MGATVANKVKAAEETDLVRRIAAGDEPALAELYDRYAGLLVALSRRVLGNQQEAEDVLQDVFVQVWNQAPRYESRRSSVSTWLVMIARSRSIDRLRSRKVQERTAQTAHQLDPKTDTSPEGMGNVLHSERHGRVRDELAKLPAEQRQVLELAFFGGFTQTEISSQTGVPLGTVKTRTLLAMKKLRKALKAEIEELL